MRCCQSGARPWARRRGKQQSARSGLAKFCRKERRCAELVQDEIDCFVWIEQQKIGVGRGVGIWKAQNEAIVGPHRFDIGAASGADSSSHCHRPGRVHAASKWGEDADAPVAEFVAQRSMTMLRSSGTVTVAIS